MRKRTHTCKHKFVASLVTNQWQDSNYLDLYYKGLVLRKYVFGMADQLRLKPACLATETS